MTTQPKPDRDMFAGLHHFGWAVCDLDASIRFYERLGFTIHERWEEDPQRCAEGLGVPGARISIVQLDGAGFRLELIQYHQPSGDEHPPRAHDVGHAHIALQVADIDKVVEDLVRLGASMVSKIQYDSAAYWVQFEDPDGLRLELIQPPA